jgi:hypothetical protein
MSEIYTRRESVEQREAKIGYYKGVNSNIGDFKVH